MRAADAEEEVAEEPVSLVAEAEELQDVADPQTESVAQTVVEAGERSQGETIFRDHIVRLSRGSITGIIYASSVTTKTL